MTRFVWAGLGIASVAIVGLVLAARPDDNSNAAQTTIDAQTTSTDATATTTSTETGPALPATTSTVTGELDPPIRAAFFYPWFPHAWDQRGIDPFTEFSPMLGRYDSQDPAIIDQQLTWARNARLDAFIASWWGVGHHTDDALLGLIDQSRQPGSPHPDLKWAIYYEEEGRSDPSPEQLVEDLQYLGSRYFGNAAYLRVDDRPVVFVWADGDDGADMADRWKSASSALNEEIYVVLKVFAGYRSISNPPDSWHQYAPATPYSEHLPYSVAISPGFWLAGESPRLERDPARFKADVRRMETSGALWHLVTTWNEWGEGTAIEPAIEYGSAYLEALAGSSIADDPESTTDSVTFTAGGDIGATAKTELNLNHLKERKGEFFLALGDLSYSDLKPETAWCDYVKSHLGDDFPIQVVVGNHEDDDRHDGFIGEFASCMPDRMSSSGLYGVQYYFDVEGLIRIVMIAADTEVDGVKYRYRRGDPHYEWLSDAIDSARSSGTPWVVVGMHKPCLTAGIKDCEIGEDLASLLTEKRVDLVLAGHEHNYQRSKQLTCVKIEVFDPGCVANDGSLGLYERGAGTVFVTAGAMGGSSPYPIDPVDPEYPYFAATLGKGDPDESTGYLEITVSLDSMYVTFTASSSDFSDDFAIK